MDTILAYLQHGYFFVGLFISRDEFLRYYQPIIIYAMTLRLGERTLKTQRLMWSKGKAKTMRNTSPG